MARASPPRDWALRWFEGASSSGGRFSCTAFRASTSASFALGVAHSVFSPAIVSAGASQGPDGGNDKNGERKTPLLRRMSPRTDAARVSDIFTSLKNSIFTSESAFLCARIGHSSSTDIGAPRVTQTGLQLDWEELWGSV